MNTDMRNEARVIIGAISQPHSLASTMLAT